MYQYILGLRFRLSASQDFAHGNAGPAVVEAAPTRDAVKVACGLDARELIEFFPVQAERMLDKSGDAKIPMRRIESWNRPVMQDRPLQRKRLPRRQTSFATHLLLFAFALVARENSREN